MPMSDAMVDSPFFKEVRSAFGVLLQRGALTIISSAFDEEAFGNAEVVLAGQNFYVRLVRDRGNVFADARSSASPDWRPLERVLCAVGVVSAPAEGLLPVAKAARLIEAHLSMLESGLAPQAWASTARVLRGLDSDAGKRVDLRWRSGHQDRG